MPRNTEVFGPGFLGEGIVRSADITKDPRSATNESYFGMPDGHLPVRSYLAAPLKFLDRAGCWAACSLDILKSGFQRTG